MKTIIIEVTDEDIDLGVPCKVEHCAVARAVSRAVPLAASVASALGGYIHLRTFDGEKMEVHHTLDAWIKAFDAFKAHGIGSRPLPFTFPLDVPDCFVPLNAVPVLAVQNRPSPNLLLGGEKSEARESNLPGFSWKAAQDSRGGVQIL